MKVLILAGGMGTRISEETEVRPKPMVEIGGRPILWHIMKIYSAQGFNDFVVLLGYKGHQIKEYFSNYFLYNSNVTIDFSKNKTTIHNHKCEPWRVTLVDTGLDALTGARIKQAKPYIGKGAFLMTYGDGVSDVDLKALLRLHRANKKAMTMTAVQPQGKYGSLEIEGKRVVSFCEKPKGDRSWVNGGFFACESEIFDYIPEDENVFFERKPLRQLAADGNLHAYKHSGFWKCMDTLRDKIELEALWRDGKAPWKIWKD